MAVVEACKNCILDQKICIYHSSTSVYVHFVVKLGLLKFPHS